MIGMLSSVIIEGDKKLVPVELSNDNMRKFLSSYEKLREQEKRMISEGYPDKLLRKSKRLYGPLIKVLATRSQAV